MTITRAPLSLRIAKGLYRRGSRRLPALVLKPAIALGRLDRVATYQLAPGIEIDVPLRQNMWDSVDVVTYERALIGDLQRGIAALPAPVTFVDCGADVGIVSLHVAAACPNVMRIVAFEPNPVSFPHLERNLDRLAITTDAVHRGVADFTGSGRLQAPDYDGTSHARFVVPDPAGTVQVTRVDDEVDEVGSLAVKIDVEGSELAVLAGAERLLRSADGFVVAFEAHRQVLGRTGIDPMEVVRFVQSLRPCTATVSERPGVELDADRPFFDQVEGANVFNVVLTAT